MPYARAGALAVAIGLFTTGVAAQDARQPGAAAPVKEKKSCRMLMPTGSLMSTRVCNTKAGWDAFDGHNAQGAADFRKALRMTATNERQ